MIRLILILTFTFSVVTSFSSCKLRTSALSEDEEIAHINGLAPETLASREFWAPIFRGFAEVLDRTYKENIGSRKLKDLQQGLRSSLSLEQKTALDFILQETYPKFLTAIGTTSLASPLTNLNLKAEIFLDIQKQIPGLQKLAFWPDELRFIRAVSGLENQASILLSSSYGFETYRYLGTWMKFNNEEESSKNKVYVGEFFDAWKNEIISRKVFERVKKTGHPLSRRDSLSMLAKTLAEAGNTSRRTAQLLGVKTKAVETNLSMALLSQTNSKWTTLEEQTLRNYLDNTDIQLKTWEAIASQIGKSVFSCQEKVESEGWATKENHEKVRGQENPSKLIRHSGLYHRENLMRYLTERFRTALSAHSVDNMMKNYSNEVASDLGLNKVSVAKLLHEAGLGSKLNNRMLEKQIATQSEIQELINAKTQKIRPDGLAAPSIPLKNSPIFLRNKQVYLDLIFQAALDHFEYQQKEDQTKRGLTSELHFPNSKTGIIKSVGQGANIWLGRTNKFFWESVNQIFSSHSEFLHGFFVYAESIAATKGHRQYKIANQATPFRLFGAQHKHYYETFGEKMYTRALAAEQAKIVDIGLALMAKISAESEEKKPSQGASSKSTNTMISSTYIGKFVNVAEKRLGSSVYYSFALPPLTLISRLDHARQQKMLHGHPSEKERLSAFNWLEHFATKPQNQKEAEIINKIMENDRKKYQKKMAMKAAYTAVKNGVFPYERSSLPYLGVKFLKLVKDGNYKSNNSAQYIFESKEHYLDAAAKAAVSLQKELEKKLPKTDLAVQRVNALQDFIQFKKENLGSPISFRIHLQQNGIPNEERSLEQDAVDCLNSCTCLHLKAGAN